MIAMTFAEELVRDAEKMRANGKTADEIADYVDQAIADWNMREYERQGMRRMVQEATA